MQARDEYVREGDILAGKYRVERVLGVGGMGVVVAAHHQQLDTRVAIKLLLPEMLTSAEAVTRFVREARAAAKITNEHVARVHDVGTLESGAPYMVMELLEGADLAAVLHEHGPLSVEQAVELLLQACEAVAEAHGLGIIHRDLKPANLFWVQRADGLPSIKVLDFGISKALQSPMSGSTTRTSTMLGTPHYMSPEQMTSSRDIDIRSDLWALGVILYQLLSNQVPFDGDTLPAVCIQIATQPPRSLRGQRPELPQAIEAVITRCLQKDPNQRFANVAEFALALASFAPARALASIERIERTQRPITGSAPVPKFLLGAGDRSSAPPVPTVAPFGLTHSGGLRRTGSVVWKIGLGTSLPVLAVLGFMFVRGHRESPSAAGSAGLAAPSGQLGLPGAVEGASASKRTPVEQAAPAPTPVETALVVPATEQAKPEQAAPAPPTPVAVGLPASGKAAERQLTGHPLKRVRSDAARASSGAARAALAKPAGVAVPAAAGTALGAAAQTAAPPTTANPTRAFDDRQ